MTAHDQLNAGLSIGELAKLTGVKIETIRYYERERIIPSPARTAGGHRVYTNGQARRLQFVKRSRGWVPPWRISGGCSSWWMAATTRVVRFTRSSFYTWTMYERNCAIFGS